MKNPYAESTLKRKYRESGLEKEKLCLIIDYMTACAHFYQIIELSEARRILEKQGGITEKELDQVLPIMERDGTLDFYIIQETELYKDGRDEYLIIDQYLLFEENAENDKNAENSKEDHGKQHDYSNLITENWDRFFELDQYRYGKPLYVPEDILPYADDDYYEETPQVLAMKDYLLKALHSNSQKNLSPRQINRKRILIEDRTEKDVEWLIRSMIDMINNLSVPPSEHIKKCADMLEELGYTFRNRTDFQQFLNLFGDLNNHTRMPCNRGNMPNELYQRSNRTYPQEVVFGAGLQNIIKTDEKQGKEMKQAILNDPYIPMELKTNLMKEVDRALKPGEEKQENSTLVTGGKIRPNDPCPCGSGKKYKKCCGMKH